MTSLCGICVAQRFALPNQLVGFLLITRVEPQLVNSNRLKPFG